MKKSIVLSVFLCFVLGVIANVPSMDTTVIDEDGRVFSSSRREIGSVDYQDNFKETTLTYDFTTREDYYIDWSNSQASIPISDLDNRWSSKPKAKFDSNDILHVVYEDKDASMDNISYQYRNSFGLWSEPVIVDKFIEARNNHTPALGVSANNDLHIAFTYWAYDNAKSQISYTHYNAATNDWNQEIVSDAGGSVTNYTDIQIFSSTESNPVIAWSEDYREDMINPKIYLSFHNGTEWSENQNVSSLESTNAWSLRQAEIDEDHVMLMYKESDGVDTWVAYRIWDHTTQTLSEPVTLIENLAPLRLYDIVKHQNTIQLIYGASAIMYLMEYDLETQEWSNLAATFNGYSATGNNYISFFLTSHDDILNIVYHQWHIVNSVFTYEIKYAEVINDELTQSNVMLTVPEALPTSSISTDVDSEGNVHLLFADNRYDAPGAFDTHEIMYRKGFIEQVVGNDEQSSPVIAEGTLNQNYPNPFNPSTTFSFSLNSNEKESANIEVYNLKGQLVKILPGKDATKTSENNFSITWDGTNQQNSTVVSGLYLYKLVENNKTLAIKKALLLK